MTDLPMPGPSSRIVPFEGDRNVYVASMPQTMTDKSLASLFAQFGPIEAAKAVMDPITRRCKGYGFVLFGSSEAANAAICCMNGCIVDGSRLQVRMAHRSATPTTQHAALTFQQRLLDQQAQQEAFASPVPPPPPYEHVASPVAQMQPLSSGPMLLTLPHQHLFHSHTVLPANAWPSQSSNAHFIAQPSPMMTPYEFPQPTLLGTQQMSAQDGSPMFVVFLPTTPSAQQLGQQ